MGFDEWYERLRPQIMRRFAKWVGIARCEEIYQDVSVTVWRDWVKVPKGNVGGVFFRRMELRCLDEIRAQRIRDRIWAEQKPALERCANYTDPFHRAVMLDLCGDLDRIARSKGSAGGEDAFRQALGKRLAGEPTSDKDRERLNKSIAYRELKERVCEGR